MSCTNTLSVSWDGWLYDCDFNQMLELKVASKVKHISEYNEDLLNNRNIVISQHCYGCTQVPEVVVKVPWHDEKLDHHSIYSYRSVWMEPKGYCRGITTLEFTYHSIHFSGGNAYDTASRKGLDFRCSGTEEYDVSRILALYLGYRDFSEENFVATYKDKEQPIIIYCSIGIRSENIAEKLNKLGYTEVKIYMVVSLNG